MSDRSGFRDVVRQKGQLVPSTTRMPPRPYDVIEEMYGMIWKLAGDLEHLTNTPAEDFVNEARDLYRDGLYLSPTLRYRNST
jgi:hypothetical protein